MLRRGSLTLGVEDTRQALWRKTLAVLIAGPLDQNRQHYVNLY